MPMGCPVPGILISTRLEAAAAFPVASFLASGFCHHATRLNFETGGVT